MGPGLVKLNGTMNAFRESPIGAPPFAIVAATRAAGALRGPDQSRRLREDSLATRKEISDFLASVERRAFKQSVYAVHDDEAALDIVQDAMLDRKSVV